MNLDWKIYLLGYTNEASTEAFQNMYSNQSNKTLSKYLPVLSSVDEVLPQKLGGRVHARN